MLLPSLRSVLLTAIDRVCRARVIVDRFADLMDLRSDRSRLDAYFGGSMRQRRQASPGSAAAAAPAAAAARTTSAAVAAHAAAEVVDTGSWAAASETQSGPALQQWDAAEPSGEAEQPASPLICADSCGDASEWDAMSEGSPPPEHAAAEEPPELSSPGAAAEGVPCSEASPAREAGPLCRDSAVTQQQADALAAQHGMRMQTSCGAAEAEAVDAGDSQTLSNICGGAAAAGQPAADPAANAASAQDGYPAGCATAAAPAAMRGAAATGAAAEAALLDELDDAVFALDSVSVREQELILAMITARRACRNSGGSSSSPLGGSGVQPPSSSGGGGGGTGNSTAARRTSGSALPGSAARRHGVSRSAPLPSVSQSPAAYRKTAAGDGNSPAAGKQKRQRTLAGFIVPRAESCKS